MDFADQLKAHASTIAKKLEHISTEEATKTSLIMPFIQILGYDVFDITEVVPEFDANVGAAKKYKLDYAILQNGNPIILIECKSHNEKLEDAYSQLFHYFAATEARIGILTDGVHYHFYADLEKPHKMDSKPFLRLDLNDLSDSVIPELKKLTKPAFNLDNAINSATLLKYTGGIKSILRRQIENPDDDFVKLFFKELCPGSVFTGKLKEDFIGFTRKSFKEFIQEEMTNLIHDFSTTKDPTNLPTAEEIIPPPNVREIETTEEELQSYYIVKAILCQTVDQKRIVHRDTLSYFNILLDDNKLKPICRLYLNTANKKLGWFSVSEDKKQENKIDIDSVEDLYKYAEQLKATVNFYDS